LIATVNRQPTPTLAGCAAATIEGCMRTIENLDRQVHAFVRLAPDLRSRAAECGQGGRKGILQNVPVAVKDVIATAGLGTEYGSDFCAGNVPREDADCVRLVKAAGAIVVGKTATTEFAHLRPPRTRNPWNLAHTPGGSSSGSAAAVAAGMVPLALGTQTGGSIIRPASYCGVFGFKASQNRASFGGVHELARSFDSLGWFATSSADLTSLAAVLLTATPTPLAPAKPLRLGRLWTTFDVHAHPSMLRLCDQACRRLAAQGTVILDVTLPHEFNGVHELHQRVTAVEASRALAAYGGHLSPLLADFVSFGHSSAARYKADSNRAKALGETFTALAQGIDAFLLPAATGEAPAGLEFTGEAIFNLPFSLLGAPCASLPVGFGPRGLPLGLQLVAERGQDERLLAVVALVSHRLGLEPVALSPLVPSGSILATNNLGDQNG